MSGKEFTASKRFRLGRRTKRERKRVPQTTFSSSHQGRGRRDSRGTDLGPPVLLRPQVKDLDNSRRTETREESQRRRGGRDFVGRNKGRVEGVLGLTPSLGTDPYWVLPFLWTSPKSDGV